MDLLVNQRRNRLQLLNWQLQLNQQQNVNNMLILQVQQAHARYQKCRRSVWAIPWKAPERRLQLGHYSRLMEELRCEDANSFKNFVRVDPEMWKV